MNRCLVIWGDISVLGCEVKLYCAFCMKIFWGVEEVLEGIAVEVREGLVD